MADNAELLDDALGFVSTEAKHGVLDAVACMLHNDGYGLECNTEVSDLRWLARQMWTLGNDGRAVGDFDREPPGVQTAWLGSAQLAWRALPALMDRVAHRMQLQSRVLRTLERAERLRRDRARDARRRP